MDSGLTPSGWAMLILAWGTIITCTVFCFARVLRDKDK
jgi:hypothetical protein